MRVNFQELKTHGHKSVKCAGGCGKRLVRQRVFSQTLNPFNKTPDGTVKSSEDIYRELRAAADKWAKEPETCQICGRG